MPAPHREAFHRLKAGDVSCPRSLRACAVEAVRVAAEADTALFYTCADAAPGQPVVQTIGAGGAPRVEEAFEREVDTIATLNQTARDLRRVPRPQRQRFHRLEDFPAEYRRQFEASEHFARVWTGAGVDDAVRLFEYDTDGHFAGWIGGVHVRGSGRISVQQRRSVQRIRRAVQDALITAARLERIHRPHAPGLIVARPDGAIELTSGAGDRWLEDPSFRRALTVALRASRPSEDADSVVLRIADARARLYRLSGHGGDRIAVHLAPMAPVRLSPAAELTPAQRRVADLGAVGMTVPEIADELEVSPYTVREHLKNVYRVLGVANRVELARVLREAAA